jgi:cell division protein FtsN
MSEHGYREIQLTGKQLVFLFMASVVLAVAIFLLGVSVGRGVRATSQTPVEPAGAQAAALDPAAGMPPETKLTPSDLSYHTKLQGQPEPQPAAASARESAPPKAPAGQPQTSPAPPPAPATSKPSGQTASSASTAPVSEDGGWYVQTGAFSTRANADRSASELKAKGHTAIVMRVSDGVPFRVRLGPFTDRVQADRLSARLKAEGISSSVTR